MKTTTFSTQTVIRKTVKFAKIKCIWNFITRLRKGSRRIKMSNLQIKKTLKINTPKSKQK